ncbi:ribosomal biogenesis regulatory protein [Nadsonia fulvescens var. elongata DSM 6958]|uniref:Ribosome biogenesis regulatory protein n=1 Tax=Nadsonia fulvescens var. elongata DSM 6958 TaxID=857566 RepID=A0A1E3PSR2_9ASCO|nr:ribosomal biogenesis regulatory protein [Nadsonia fulvescens var. elongata DSM 6958]
MSEQIEIKSIVVEKPIPVNYDLGNLTVFDINPLEAKELASETKEAHLKAVTRDNAQLLINQILSLPIKTTTESNSSTGNQDSTMTLVQLPEPLSLLPREKPLPKAKEPTKWELFAAKKGIRSKAKDGKLVYDEDAGKWVPKWGYGGINKKLDDQWLVEVPEEKIGTADELVDPRSLGRTERKKLVKKNQLQQEKNKRGVSK